MEIERKFIPKQLPDLSQYSKVEQERYYLYINDDTELRIQRKGLVYQLERKTKTSNLGRDTQILTISAEEFNALKQNAGPSIIRDSYQISDHPHISIKIYHGDHEDLIRAEFEFDSEQQAQDFTPPDWVGVEITHSPLGQDAKLIQLSPSQFTSELQKLT